MIKYIKQLIHEPYEKIYINIFLIIILAFVYYKLYLDDTESFIINEKLLKKKGGQLNFFDFLYFSLLNQLTLSYGDIIPFTNNIKIIVSFQTLFFWSVALY